MGTDDVAIDDGRERERVDAIVSLWSDGDYHSIAELFDPVSEAVVASLDLAGARVLDAATGTGNTAIHAARAGADVDAFDLTPPLLEVARSRAAAVGLDIRFVEGDLLDMPYDDARFDVVLSTFGAFVVDDQPTCARELVRVCRPGGRVVMTAWAATGMFGVMVDLMREHAPTLFEQVPDQRAWAEPDRLEALFAGTGVDVEVAHDTVWFRFPSVAAALDLFEAASGPVQRMKAGVASVGGEWSLLRAATAERWSRLARPAADGAVELPGDYALATVRRR